MPNRDVRKWIYKAMYNALRESGLVHGEKVIFPDDITDLIRDMYPDQDTGTHGKYKDQHVAGRKFKTLDEFFGLAWKGGCVCPAD